MLHTQLSGYSGGIWIGPGQVNLHYKLPHVPRCSLDCRFTPIPSNEGVPFCFYWKLEYYTLPLMVHTSIHLDILYKLLYWRWYWMRRQSHISTLQTFLLRSLWSHWLSSGPVSYMETPRMAYTRDFILITQCPNAVFYMYRDMQTCTHTHDGLVS